MIIHPSEIGKYKIIRYLGSGCFSDVYFVKDRALDADKAIKVLKIANPKDFMKEFEEAQILNKCRHKHIVGVNEANLYKIDGQLKVVIDMEYISGGSLENVMKNRFISATESLQYIIDILFGLEFSHQNGILHRDIKPGNIMLTDIAAKLSDFGLATNVGAKKPGSPRGYTTHLPPEFFTNIHTTPLTDIYASGVTFFRIVNNLTDWTSQVKSIKDFTKKIRNGKLIPAIGYKPHIPNKIKRVINKACHPNPAKRHQSPKEMRQALEKITPSISWKFNTNKKWCGVCSKTGIEHETNIIIKKSNSVVDIKKNNRRIGAACKQFDNNDEAVQYMYSYIAETTVI